MNKPVYLGMSILDISKTPMYEYFIWAFIEYSNDMYDVYKNISDYNPDKENKILIVYDDMIADMINNKQIIL